jgi:Transposase DDE domain/Domain of unknown function (DUF4372)
MAQNTVFAQVIKLIRRSEFESYVHHFEGDKGVRNLDCWTWFGALLFGQLTGHDSIRAIERVFAHSDAKMQKLGFGTVRRSTLADANCKRPLGVLEEVFKTLLVQAKSLAPKKKFDLPGQVLAVDSSTIELCLSLCPWALYHKTNKDGAAKMHVAIDVANDLPEFCVVTNGRGNDLTIARGLQFKSGTTLVVDRGYAAFDWFSDLNQKDIFFVTRSRKKLIFKVAKSRPSDRTLGIKCDQEIYINGQGTKGKYKGKLRRISYHDPDTGKRLCFLTNRFDVDAKVICDLYKSRWQVELFFKTLKQNLRIKKFLGTSAHAVKAQIWVALIAYLLIQIWRYTLKTSISTPSAMAAIGVLLLLKEPLSRLLGNLPLVTRHPPSPQLTLNI